MKLLLDANAFIWAYSRPAELTVAARRAIGDTANERLVSIAALWEIAVKQSLGKLVVSTDLAKPLADLALEVLPIGLGHLARVQQLPFHHRDPFDRMLIAQAIEENLTIVTRDRRFHAYGVPVLTA